jgi:type I restriction enzyme S subunit
VGSTIGSIAEEQKLKVEPSQNVPDGTYIGLEHIDRRFLWPIRTGQVSDVTSTKSAFAVGDTLFGKLRPYFHKVVVAPGEGVCSTDIIVIRPKRPELSLLVAASCSSDAVVASAVQNSNGTRMPRAKWIDIADCSVPDPDSPAVERFVSLSSAVAERCLAAVAEIEVLARTRDELLPLLMNGRISVRQAADTAARLL